MTHKTQKSISHWTYKHEEFCLKNQIPRAAQLMWEWLIKDGKVNIETEPELKDFNEWVEKFRGRGYCRNTLKSAFSTLVENRVVNLVKRYTWCVVKIVTRPLEFLEPKRNLQKRKLSDTLVTPNGMFVDAVSYQQQQERIVNNQLLFSEYGIHFNEYEIDVLNRPKNEVLLAIVLYQIKDSRVSNFNGEIRYYRANKIPNPEGWIKTCLTRRYWDEPTNYAQIFWKYSQTNFWDELFPDGSKFDNCDIFNDKTFRGKRDRRRNKDFIEI